MSKEKEERMGEEKKQIVKNGNRCVGCTLLGDFPEKCGNCGNLTRNCKNTDPKECEGCFAEAGCSTRDKPKAEETLKACCARRSCMLYSHGACLEPHTYCDRRTPAKEKNDAQDSQKT